jgi:hypothetical protein
MTTRRRAAAHHPPVDPREEVPHSGIYEVLAEAGRADDARRERFYGPLFAEMREPGAFPRAIDFFAFAGRQWERLKVELGDFHLYAEEKPFLLGVLCAAAVLSINMKPTEARAALGQAFQDGRRVPRLDLLQSELKKLLDQNPNLTTAGVLAAWEDEITRPECVQEVDEDGTVSWYVSPGDERTTSAGGITKRLQRLRKKETHR